MTQQHPRRRVVGWLGLGAAATALGGFALTRRRGGHTAQAAPRALADVDQGWRAPADKPQAAAGEAALGIARNGPPAELVDAALAAVGGIGRFVSKGQHVLVKPNIGWDRTPEQAANTNPEVVARIVELCLEAGAKKVTVMDRTCNDARRCYTNSGIQAAAEAAGARVVHVDEARTTPVDFGGVLGEWGVYDEILKTDVRINVPIAKHHGLSRLTLGMKNWMGSVGGNRSLMHQQIHKSVVDLAAWFRPALTIVDGVRVLTANGPTGGNLADVHDARTLCATADPVAADAFGTSLHGLGPDDLKSLELAEQRGLGTRDLSSLALREIDLAEGA